MKKLKTFLVEAKSTGNEPNKMSYAEWLSAFFGINILNKSDFDKEWENAYWPSECEGNKAECYKFITGPGNKPNSIKVYHSESYGMKEDENVFYVEFTKDIKREYDVDGDWVFGCDGLSDSEMKNLKKQFDVEEDD